MKFTSVSGHLMQRDFKDPKHKNWEINKIIELFDAEFDSVLIANDTNPSIQKTIKELAERARKLIIWTDCDREGENIGYEIINIARSVNMYINISRAIFSSLIASEIFSAINNLQPPNKKLSDAVEVRQSIDLLVGFAFTRFQTCGFKNLLKQYLRSDDTKALSYGPCLFPTLWFIVKQAEDRLNFEEELFHYLEVQVEMKCNSAEEPKKIVTFSWERNKVKTFEEIEKIFAEISQIQTAKINQITKKPVKKFRPIPLNSVEFTKLATKNLKISSSEAMEAAEKLYQKGIISYPRTETQIFSSNFDFTRFLNEQTKSQDWGQYVSNLISTKQSKGENLWARKGQQDDKSHPPIYPVKFPENNLQLTTNENKVYDLIARHFIAVLSNDAEGVETNVFLKVEEEKFVKSGLIILDQGFLEIYPYVKWNANLLPNFNENDIFQLGTETNEHLDKRFFRYIESGKTTPPELLTEAKLISLMDQNGIGTDATIPEHIKNVQERYDFFL